MATGSVGDLNGKSCVFADSHPEILCTELEMGFKDEALCATNADSAITFCIVSGGSNMCENCKGYNYFSSATDFCST
jgi:hypothetical protein